MNRPIIGKYYIYCFPKTEHIIVKYLGRHPYLDHFKVIQISGSDSESIIRESYTQYLVNISPVMELIYEV